MLKHASHTLLAAATTAALFAGCGEVEPTHFVLENGTDDTMYVQEFDWFRLIADGERVETTDALCMPRCGALSGVAVCAGARLARVIALQPGESVERDWDGTYYEIDEDKGCYREHHRGGDLEVEYCYSDEFDDSEIADDGEDGVYDDAWIENPTCERRAFERGDEVTLAISEVP